MNTLSIIRVIVLFGLLSVMAASADQTASSMQTPDKSAVSTTAAGNAHGPHSKAGNGSSPLAQAPGNLLNVTAGLVLVLGLIAGAAWLVRRFGQFQVGASGHLKILGGLHLSTREKLVLVQVGEEQLLLGVSPGSVRTLHVLQSPLSVQAPEQQGASAFYDKLHSTLAGIKR